jgi:hypothetical protein
MNMRPARILTMPHSSATNAADYDVTDHQVTTSRLVGEKKLMAAAVVFELACHPCGH